MTSTTSFSVGRAPGALPLLGHVPSLARHPLQFLSSLRTHWDVVEIRIGPKKAYVPCHPELFEQVLRDPAGFDRRGFFFDKIRQVFGNGLVTCGWADHQQQRPMLQPAFSRAYLDRYTKVIHEEVVALTASWRPGQTIDVKPVTDALLTRITSRTLFAAELGSEAVDQIQDSLSVLTEGTFYRMMDVTGLVEKLPIAINRRFADAQTRLRVAVDQVIDRYRESGTDHGDMLSLLLAARDERTGAGLSDQDIYDQVLTILGASVETTGTTLAWALHLLGQHPEVEARMHAEIDQLTRLPTFAEALRLDYTRRVITEVLRMYPAVWLLTRTAVADTVLGGHRIKAGSLIVLTPYLLHHDPEIYTDPERFDPDRWLPDRATPLQRHAFLPFGAGPRKCIGDVLSMTETTMALAGIAARWQLRLTPGTHPRTTPRAALLPTSLSMVIQPRT
jgi:cytochrome P450